MGTTNYILQLNEAGINDIDRVGGKNASLGEMLQNLKLLGIDIPFGFIVVADAYYRFIKYNQLDVLISTLISATDVDDLAQLKQCGGTIRRLIRDGEFPEEIKMQVADAYDALCAYYQKNGC